MPDAHPLFAYSTVATAPSPATSGTSLVVAAGEGTKFAEFPFNATVWPVGAQPSTANAEIVRITNVSTDTLTIVRAQEGSSARSIVVGDQIAVTITPKALTDIETLARLPGAPVAYRAGRYLTSLGSATSGVLQGTLNTAYFAPISLPFAVTFDRIGVTVRALVASSKIRVGIYADDGNIAPGALLVDSGQIDGNTATGLREVTISQACGPGIIWVASVAQGGNPSVSSISSTTATTNLYALGWWDPAYDGVGPATAHAQYSEASVTGALPATATPVWGTPAGGGVITTARVVLRMA